LEKKKERKLVKREIRVFIQKLEEETEKIDKEGKT
jgi:hypothetical protein